MTECIYSAIMLASIPALALLTLKTRIDLSEIIKRLKNLEFGFELAAPALATATIVIMIYANVVKTQTGLIACDKKVTTIACLGR